jgi:predicted GNAT family N-acyltransferase
MLAKRGTLQALKEPQYEFRHVPKTARDLKGSVVLAVNDRDVWISSLAEILLLCNEAAYRRNVRFYVPPAARGKPLALEYLADRMDLDDPLHGYMVRTENEGWLQGFVTITTFTTWQRWFRWDSLIPEAGIIDESIDEEDDEELAAWLKRRKRDLTGALAVELQTQTHDGDYLKNGTIWPKIAEISLLGGLGCGSWLMNKIIHDLSQSSSKYEYIVLQATENAVEFYERFGFVRVGAVARYEELVPSDDEETEDEESEEESDNDDGESSDACTEEENDSDDSEEGSSDDSDDSTSSDGSSGDSDDNTASEDEGVPKLSARELRARAREVALKTAQATEEKPGDDGTDPMDVDEEPKAAQNPSELVSTEGGKRKSAKRNKEDDGAAPGTPAVNQVDATGPAMVPLPGLTSLYIWYTAKADETPITIAKKHGVSTYDVVFLNKRSIPTLTSTSKLYKGTVLRVPVAIDLEARKQEVLAKEYKKTKAAEPGDMSDPDALYYYALDDETPRQIAVKLGVDQKELIEVNKKKVDGINRFSKFVEGTKLRIPGREKLLNEEEQKNLDAPDLVAYRHWTFSNDSVDTTCVSYMMVRKLDKVKSRARDFDVPPPVQQVYERAFREVTPDVKETRFRQSLGEEARKRKVEEGRLERIAEVERQQYLARPRTNIKVMVKTPVSRYHPGVQGKRMLGPLDAFLPGDRRGRKRLKVYVNNPGSISGPLTAALLKPLLKPMPKEPVRPKRALSGYLLYSNSQRDILVEKHPHLKITEISKLIGAKWAKMSDLEKGVYNDESAQMKKKREPMVALYEKQLKAYEHALSLRLPQCGGTKTVKSLTAKNDAAKNAKKPKHVQLFNQVVKLLHNEHGWQYYFVLTYIPDLQWVHLAPLMQCGTFKTEKRGIAMGRPKYKLAPEGKASELDVSASRCIVVRTRVMKGCPDADKEEWDVLEEKKACSLGNTMYQSVYLALQLSLVVKSEEENVYPSPSQVNAADVLSVPSSDKLAPPPAPHANRAQCSKDDVVVDRLLV